jgi:O-antigen/teichoic acid export membrane protein
MRINKVALKESVADTVLGSLINIPLNMIFLWMAKKAGLSIFTTALLLSAVFIVLAIIRKYTIREYFDNKNKPVNT